MKKEILAPYALSAIFAILCAVLALLASNWRNRAKSAEAEMAELKAKPGRIEAKKPEDRKDAAVPIPEVPAPARQEPGERSGDRFTGIREERGRDRDPAAFAENMRKRFEEMKTSDPERYDEIVRRMNESTVRMDKEMKDRLDYMKAMELDQSLMTPEEIANHGKLMEILQQNSRTLSYLAENPEAEDASQLRMELFQSARETRPLLETERKLAIRKVGAQNGLQGESLKKFEEEVGKAYDMTSMGMGRVGGEGRGGR